MTSTTIPTLENVEAYLRKDLVVLNNLSDSRNIVYGPSEIHKAIEAFGNNMWRYRLAIQNLEDALYDSELVGKFHSTRKRIKDYYHLAEKLKRKFEAKENWRAVTSDSIFTKEGINDLGGIRILHLYKKQWLDIHNYIIGGWGGVVECVERIAYVRWQDQSKFEPYFQQVKVRRPEEGNYTSLHYVLKLKELIMPSFDSRSSQRNVLKEKDIGDIFIECQVRTVFEDGWGEVDHDVRYPYETTARVKEQLNILSQSVHTANDIATALETLNNLPVFVPCERELALERSSDNIYCLTPTLQWAAENSSDLIALLKSSSLHYHFLVFVDSRNDDQKGPIVELLEERKRKIEGVLDNDLRQRVHFPEMRNIDVPLVLVSDLLLLHNVNEPFKDKYHLGIMSPPLSEELTDSEKIDIIIRDNRLVERICELFNYLAPSLNIKL